MTIYRLAELTTSYKDSCRTNKSGRPLERVLVLMDEQVCLLPVSQKACLVLQKCISDVDPKITHESVLLRSQWANNPVNCVIVSGAVRGATRDQKKEKEQWVFLGSLWPVQWKYCYESWYESSQIQLMLLLKPIWTALIFKCFLSGTVKANFILTVRTASVKMRAFAVKSSHLFFLFIYLFNRET